MNKKLLKTTFFWGFILWLIGYLLGIILFPVVPSYLLGWILMPIGIIITVIVLFKKIHATTLRQYAMIGSLWTLIAIACDYLFIVKLINPPDGYYKVDVYLYYLLTFILPLVIGWRKKLLQ